MWRQGAAAVRHSGWRPVRVVLPSVAFALASAPVAGQQLYASGLAGVVQHLQRDGVIHTLSTVSGDGDERCAVSEVALAAEAERTLRRSGLAAEPLPESTNLPIVLLFIKVPDR